MLRDNANVVRKTTQVEIASSEVRQESRRQVWLRTEANRNDRRECGTIANEGGGIPKGEARADPEVKLQDT